MDDNTKKICWKCGKYHEAGAEYCPFCGVSFITEDMHYQTDGRTISAKDDKAYLSSPPPKYKSNKKKIVVGALVIVAVLLVAALMVPTSPYPADGKYVRVNYGGYAENGVYEDGWPYQWCEIYLTIANEDVTALHLSDITVKIPGAYGNNYKLTPIGENIPYFIGQKETVHATFYGEPVRIDRIHDMDIVIESASDRFQLFIDPNLEVISPDRG